MAPKTRKIVRYRVHPDRAEENAGLIREVFAELATARPAGLEYAVYRGADQLSFTHIVAIDPAVGGDPLRALAAFRAFAAGAKERCDEGPVSVEVTVVGAYAGPGGEDRATPPRGGPPPAGPPAAP